MQVKWDYRFIGAEPGQTNFCVNDGSDFRICEPRKRWWAGWWSFKFNGPAVRYEITSAKATGLIVATNGPFPPAEFTDPVIFSSYLAAMLLPGETVDADKAYRGTPGARTQDDMEDDFWVVFSITRHGHDQWANC